MSSTSTPSPLDSGHDNWNLPSSDTFLTAEFAILLLGILAVFAFISYFVATWKLLGLSENPLSAKPRNSATSSGQATSPTSTSAPQTANEAMETLTEAVRELGQTLTAETLLSVEEFGRTANQVRRAMVATVDPRNDGEDSSDADRRELDSTAGQPPMDTDGVPAGDRPQDQETDTQPAPDVLRDPGARAIRDTGQGDGERDSKELPNPIGENTTPDYSGASRPVLSDAIETQEAREVEKRIIVRRPGAPRPPKPRPRVIAPRQVAQAPPLHVFDAGALGTEADGLIGIPTHTERVTGARVMPGAVNATHVYDLVFEHNLSRRADLLLLTVTRYNQQNGIFRFSTYVETTSVFDARLNQRSLGDRTTLRSMVCQLVSRSLFCTDFFGLMSFLWLELDSWSRQGVIPIDTQGISILIGEVMDEFVPQGVQGDAQEHVGRGLPGQREYP